MDVRLVSPAATEMYDVSEDGRFPLQPRVGVRIDSCAACIHSDHRKHCAETERRPIIFCDACRSPAHHVFVRSQPRASTQTPATAMFDSIYSCRCGHERTYGAYTAPMTS